MNELWISLAGKFLHLFVKDFDYGSNFVEVKFRMRVYSLSWLTYCTSSDYGAVYGHCELF